MRMFLLGGAAALLMLTAAVAAPTDPQIAHIAYTAGQIDVAAGKQALARSHDKRVRAFALEMVRDHYAVNVKALALVKKLHVTPEGNPTRAALSKGAAAKLNELAGLHGRFRHGLWRSTDMPHPHPSPKGDGGYFTRSRHSRDANRRTIRTFLTGTPASRRYPSHSALRNERAIESRPSSRTMRWTISSRASSGKPQ